MTKRMVVLVVFGAMAALLAGCGSESDTAKTPAPVTVTESVTVAAEATPAAPNKAAPPQAAAPASSGGASDQSDEGFTYLGGSAQIVEDGLGQFSGRMRVRNDGDKRTGLFTVSVLKGGAVLTTLQGAADSVEPGKTVTVDLISTDDYVPGPYEIEFVTEGAY